MLNNNHPDKYLLWISLHSPSDFPDSDDFKKHLVQHCSGIGLEQGQIINSPNFLRKNYI